MVKRGGSGLQSEPLHCVCVWVPSPDWLWLWLWCPFSDVCVWQPGPVCVCVWVPFTELWVPPFELPSLHWISIGAAYVMELKLYMSLCISLSILSCSTAKVLVNFHYLDAAGVEENCHGHGQKIDNPERSHVKRLTSKLQLSESPDQLTAFYTQPRNH